MGRLSFIGLPLPPARNYVEGMMNPIQKGRVKNQYRRKVWAAAIQQHKPFFEPPPHVRMRLLYRVKREHDVDGLDLKWLLDALGQKQLTDWRQGLASSKGYYVDDKPANLTWEKPSQHVDPKAPQGLDLILEWDEC